MHSGCGSTVIVLIPLSTRQSETLKSGLGFPSTMGSLAMRRPPMGIPGNLQRSRTELCRIHRHQSAKIVRQWPAKKTAFDWPISVGVQDAERKRTLQRPCDCKAA